MVHEGPSGSESSAADLSLAEAYEFFVPVRGIRPGSRTQENYDDAWGGLVKYLRTELGREPRVSDFGSAALDRLAEAGMSERSWTTGTAKSYTGGIRSVASGLEAVGVLPPGCIANFRSPKVEKTLPVFFTDQQLAAIFSKLEATRTERNLRLRAFANVMLDAGPRPEEVSHLAFGDLWLESSQIRIAGKGGKERVVPVGERTWEYLSDYLRCRARPTAPHDPVFVAVRTPLRAVDPTTMASEMHDLLVELGIGEGGP